MGPAPGYPFHYYYNKVDISEYVRSGQNVIAVHTYYQGLINRVWVSGDDRHGLILDITQDHNIVLSSDETFLCSYHTGFEQMGKYGYDTQFAERYISYMVWPASEDLATKNGALSSAREACVETGALFIKDIMEGMLRDIKIEFPDVKLCEEL